MKRGIIILFLTLSTLSLFAEQKYSIFLGDVDAFPFIVINKTDLTLSLIDQNGNTIKEYLISCAENFGNKLRRGDHKTPEGFFNINQILNSSALTHDFHDGRGEIEGAYGPWFLRLDVPGFHDIGIHGTNNPSSIGGRNSEGCIRMNNDDISELKTFAFLGMNVIILPDDESNDNGLFTKYYDSLKNKPVIPENEDTPLESSASDNEHHGTLLYLAIGLIIALLLLCIRRAKK